MPRTNMGRLASEVLREKTALTVRTLIELSAKAAGYKVQQDAADALQMPVSTYKNKLKSGIWTLQELQQMCKAFAIQPEIMVKILKGQI